MNKMSQKCNCKIDANSMSTCKFDHIPTVFIWKDILNEQCDNKNLQIAYDKLNKYLIKNNNINFKQDTLNVEIASEDRYSQ